MRHLAILLVLGACDWSLHRMQEQPRCTVHGATNLLPNDSCDLAPPPGTVSILPDVPAPPITRALLERGRDRFDRICAPCHGVAADGDSQVARAMTLRRPPSLVDTTVSQFTDDRILTVIENGYGVMPSYRGLLSVRDRHAVLNYIRVLQQRITALDALPPALQQEASRWLQ